MWQFVRWDAPDSVQVHVEGMLRRSAALLRPALQHARLCSAGKGSPPAQPKPAVKQAAQHAVVTSTHIFRISNPEAFMDPSKRVSWIVTGVVAALLAARFGYALYQDDGEFFESKPAPAPSDVRKTLPDGRWRAVLTRARHATALPYVRGARTSLLRTACARACGAEPCPGLTRTMRSWHGAWACHLAALGLGARRPAGLAYPHRVL